VNSRGLFINVCLDTKETRRLGLTAHICELQLVLFGFEKILVQAHAHPMNFP
jgi:hypothetical protein